MEKINKEIRKTEFKKLIFLMLQDEHCNPEGLNEKMWLRTRTIPACYFRFIAIWWVVNFTESYWGLTATIAQAFNRTHANVIYSYRKIDEMLKVQDKEVLKMIKYFEENIVAKF